MSNVLAVGGAGSVFRVEGTSPAGLWVGFWHGLIAGVTFLVSLFNDNVRMYEERNSGPMYDLGFLLGTSPLARGLFDAAYEMVKALASGHL